MPQRPLAIARSVALVGVAAWLSLRAPALPTPDTAAGAIDAAPATAAIRRRGDGEIEIIPDRIVAVAV